MKALFWTAVAVYEVAVVAGFCILPAMRRRRRGARRRTVVAPGWRFCN